MIKLPIQAILGGGILASGYVLMLYYQNIWFIPLTITAIGAFLLGMFFSETRTKRGEASQSSNFG